MLGDIFRRLFAPKPVPVEYQHEPEQDAAAVEYYRQNDIYFGFSEVDEHLALDYRLLDVPTEKMIRSFTIRKDPGQALPDLSVPFGIYFNDECPAQALRHLLRLNHLVALDVSRHPDVRGADLTQFAGLSRLTHLFACSMKWKESDFESLATLPKVRALNLNCNLVGDAEFRPILKMAGLTHLVVTVTYITDAFLQQLPQLGKLELFHADGKELTDAGLGNLSQLRRLKSLSLRETQLTDAGFKQFAKLEDLEYLDVGRTRISDASLELLGNFPRLKYLSIDETPTSDRGMSLIGRCQNLETLSLHSLPVTDRGFSALAGLKRLRKVNLEYLPITDESAKVLLGFPELNHATLNSSGLSKQQIKVIRKAVEARSGTVYG